MGKTTLMRTIPEHQPHGGTGFLQSQEITRQPQNRKRVKNGISMIPEGRQLYFGMTG